MYPKEEDSKYQDNSIVYEGMRDKRRGLSRSDNPYDDEEMHDEWEKGYDRA